MKINVSNSTNAQFRMPEPAAGERWAGFSGSAAEVLRNMREAGFSEEEIAARRLHRELGSRIDNTTSWNNLAHQRANRTGNRAAGMASLGAPPSAHLSNVENILLGLINDAQSTTDELHQKHWLRALQNHLTNTRNMMGGGRFSSSI